MDLSSAGWMRVSDLAFDRRNPRLAEFDIDENMPDGEVIRILWDTMDVRELVLSIAASGYFANEPLIIAHENGSNVVIEGNRRLAAVRVLLEPNLIEAPDGTIPNLSDEAQGRLRTLPTIVGSREDTWRYIGFKHVNGPAKWSSFAKSQYIAYVHSAFGIGLDDIATQIGDTHLTVRRLYRGIVVIQQAEKMKVFDREDRWNTRFASSHLYTGLGYTGISEFIGVNAEPDDASEPVPENKKEELRLLFLWLYGSKRQDTQPVIRSQNPDLRRLDSVVANREATAALKAGTELSYAFEISRPAPNVFEEALHAAKRDLEKARGLSSTGYDGSTQLLTIAYDVWDLAEDLYSEMERKSQPRRQARRR